MKQKVVVTRHQGLVQYLKVIGLVDDNVPVLTHASPDDVRGKIVYGVLPMNLAALAAEVIEIPLDIPPELRGKELSLEQMFQYAGEPFTYKVKRLRRIGDCPRGRAIKWLNQAKKAFSASQV